MAYDAGRATSARSEASKRRVSLIAAQRVVAYGWDRLTVDELAEVAGISRRTFFRYFRTLDEVLRPAFEVATDLFIDSFEGWDGEDLVDRVQRALLAVTRDYPVGAHVLQGIERVAGREPGPHSSWLSAHLEAEHRLAEVLVRHRPEVGEQDALLMATVVMGVRRTLASTLASAGDRAAEVAPDRARTMRRVLDGGLPHRRTGTLER